MVSLLVKSLHYYPIKSCRGIDLPEAVIETRGFRNDRRLMLVDAGGKFLTQRTQPRMALICPQLNGRHLFLSAPGMPVLEIDCKTEGKSVEVAVWGDVCRAVDQGEAAAKWFSDFLHIPCRLVWFPDDFIRPVDSSFAAAPGDQVAFADGFPFLLISQASLDDLNDRLPAPLTMKRFRPNIVVSGGAPYQEDRWRKIRIGSVVFSVVKPCSRCVIPTIDPETAKKAKEPLKTLSGYRKSADGKILFGQNLIHHSCGSIRVGDRAEVLE